MNSAIVFAGLVSFVVAATNSSSSSSSSCYALPLDTDWPSASTWNSLNDTVDGRLIATVPIGSPCHDPNYDEAACAVLQNNWTVASTQYVLLQSSNQKRVRNPDSNPCLHSYSSSSSVMQEFWANNSCDPFTDQSSSCMLGNYVSYAVDVSGVNDIISTLNFAKDHNLRLVVRNTGHE